MTTAVAGQRLLIIDALRGVAALAVCWFHFTYAFPEFVLPEMVRLSGQPGWLGVYIFFVISGVALPESMHRSGYRPRHGWRFMAKRILRIEPPYLATIALILVTAWLSIHLASHRAGEPFPYSLKQILLHVGYVNVLFGEPWISKVFWSLAVEFQYYIALALLFPVFVSPRRWVSALFLMAIALLPFAAHHPWSLAHYASVFAMGLATFQYRHGFLTKTGYLVLLASASIITALALQIVIAAISLATALGIAYFPSRAWKPLIWLGAISYPLYLLHLTVGTRLITFVMRVFPRPELNLLVLLAALVVTVAASIAMHLGIERPAQRWASAIRYRPSPAGPDAATGASEGDQIRPAM